MKNGLNNQWIIVSVLGILFIGIPGFSQTSDTKYAMPLTEVIKDIEERYQITIRDPEKLIPGKTITYAQWRYRVDVVQTLDNILSGVDLVAVNEGERKYKIRNYQYHRWSVEEGKDKLEFLSGLYHDKATWEIRREDLKKCILESLQLKNLPGSPAAKPIITHKRKMNGYTIENIAIETLPGLYVCGSIYKPARITGKIPVILCPNGHFKNGRYHPDIQIRCAMLARMGAIVINYDLFAYGESLLQFNSEDHRKSLAMVVQVLNSIRILDYLTSLPESDTSRIGITGASGGGSHTMLITAIDDRIKVSVPVVMLSCYFYGGCPCESGIPVHLCGKGTNNVELAGMAAPRPQLIISDGGDWSDHVPEIEYPYLQKIYGYYDLPDKVENMHFPDEGHDYGVSKRKAMYIFMAKYLGLNSKVFQNKYGGIDESSCTIEDEQEMKAFGKEGELLPSNAIHGFGELEKVVYNAVK